VSSAWHVALEMPLGIWPAKSYSVAAYNLVRKLT